MKNEWSDLEVFMHVGAKIGKPYIKITPRKSITFSSGFIHHAKTQIFGMTYAVLCFSKTKNAIVFRFTENSDLPGATKISINSGATKKAKENNISSDTAKGNASIAARAFFNYYSIDEKKYAGKYEAVLEDVPNLGKSWVVYLGKR